MIGIAKTIGRLIAVLVDAGVIEKEQAVWILEPLEDKAKTGHWIRLHNGIFKCDQCGKQHGRSNYCPNCGTKMEE